MHASKADVIAEADIGPQRRLDALTCAGTPCSSAAGSVAGHDTPRGELQDGAAALECRAHHPPLHLPSAAEPSAAAAPQDSGGSPAAAHSPSAALPSGPSVEPAAETRRDLTCAPAASSCVPASSGAPAASHPDDSVAPPSSTGGSSSRASDVSALTAEAGSLDDGSAVTAITEDGCPPADIWPATEEVLQQVLLLPHSLPCRPRGF